MENKPIVSVVMPVYKTEQFIEEAIHSVIEQKYKNIELICVNDCTPDGAFEICKKYQKKYPWIKLVENDINRGQEFTRNHGLDVMTGKYVMFLDSDDIIDSRMIEKMVEVAESCESDVVMSTYSMLSNGKDVPVLINSALKGTMNGKEFAETLLKPMEWKILCCIGTKLYKTSIIQNNNLRFDTKYKYNEDGGFVLSFLLICNRISYINEPFYKYRIRQFGSTMSSYRPDMFKSVVKVNELLRQLLINNGVYDHKKELYYRKLLFLMIDSLRNEARFGDENSFRDVLQTIVNYEDYEEMKKTLMRPSVLKMKQIIVLLCIQLNMRKLLYRIIA